MFQFQVVSETLKNETVLVMDNKDCDDWLKSNTTNKKFSDPLWPFTWKMEQATVKFAPEASTRNKKIISPWVLKLSLFWFLKKNWLYGKTFLLRKYHLLRSFDLDLFWQVNLHEINTASKVNLSTVNSSTAG